MRRRGSSVSSNVIEINGKRYDAASGALLGLAHPHAVSTSAAAKQSIDGFMRTSRAPQLPHPPATSQPAVLKTPAVMDVRRTTTRPTAHHVTAHHPQPATTLMRTAVKKPVIKSPATIKAQTRTDVLVKNPSVMVVPKLSHDRVDAVRKQRARQIARSSAISRYSQPAVLDLAPASPSPIRKPLAASGSRPVPPPIIAGKAAGQHSRPVSRPSHVSGRPRVHPDIFERAIAQATSHEQTFTAKPANRRKAARHNRLVSIAAGSLAVLLLVGFMAYQNIPNLTMHMAAARSGVKASLPGYHPAGFSVGRFTYQPGNVTVSYHSNSDNRSFKVIQAASQWDSQSLLSNVVATANRPYQTYNQAGRTVYVYGNDATWVDGGVWYTVTDNAALSSNQLLRLASSM